MKKKPAEEPTSLLNRHTLFPVSLFEEVLEILTKRGVNFVNYADLEMTRFLSQPRWRYIGEYTCWKTGRFDLIRAGWAAGLLLMTRSPWAELQSLARRLDRKRDAPVVLMQHDVDRVPFRTFDLLEIEKRFRVRSSSYFFCESAYDDDEPYELDVERMQSLERDGWEIGYHQNAYELAAFDKALTPRILARDVAWFRERFNLRSYVPHGGAKGSKGEVNSDWPHGGPLSGLLCAYNGPCILKEFTWCDGGAEFGQVPSDPRVFARDLPAGCRATMLMHPQYYGETPRSDVANLPISRSDWWRALWRQ